MTVTTSGSGSVTIDPEGGTYEEGTEVTLTAVPDENYLFDGWSGDVSDTSSIITVVMNSDKEVEATFSPVSGCGSYTEISIAYSFDGAGEYCWVTSDDIGYVNSWNLSSLEINGEDFTNAYSSEMPDKKDGKYYIQYVGEYSWSHVEFASLKSITGLDNVNEENISLYPNPFTESVHLDISNYQDVQSIVVIDQLGRIVERLSKNEISETITLGQTLSSGIYYVNINTQKDTYNYIINKK